jgi:OOP family OmpA-OmpF porin
MKHFLQSTFVNSAVVSSLLLAASGTAHAGERYVFGGFGTSKYNGSVKGDIDNQLTAGGLTGVQSELSESSTSYKLGVGFQFNKSFAVEGSYLDLGTLGYKATHSTGNFNLDNKVAGFNISALGLFPINGEITAFGRVGWTMATVKGSATASGVSASASEDKNSSGFGAGVIYRLTDKLGLRLEWEKVYTDINLLSVGLQAKF